MVKITNWMAYDDAEKLGTDITLFGGWFSAWPHAGRRHRWDDYIERWKPRVRPYLEALRAEVLRLGLRETGFWHEEDPRGVPVFEDGTVLLCSMRAWGDFMAAVWGEEDDLPYCYVSFAWGDPTTAEELREDMRRRPWMYPTDDGSLTIRGAWARVYALLRALGVRGPGW
jgi:hypothetical protein